MKNLKNPARGKFETEAAYLLATQIIELEDRLHRELRNQLDLAADIGERLEAARPDVPHGGWDKFLKSIGMSSTRAQLYRQVFVYRSRGEFPTGATTLRQFETKIRKARRDAKLLAKGDAETEDDQDDAGEGDDTGLHHADAASFQFGTVDLIASDPPWADADAYRTLGRIGAECLADDGLILCQCGNAHLGQAIAGLESGGLRHLWTLAIVYPETRPQKAAGLSNAWVPVLVAGHNRPRGKLSVPDMFACPTYEKELHPWEQSPEPWRYWLPALAPDRRNVRVADPFSGSGTIGAVCAELGFSFVGTEKDEGHYRTAKNRL